MHAKSFHDDPDLSQVTQWLEEWNAGDVGARDRLFSWVYPLARGIAARHLARHSVPDMATTQLAHDTLLRLLERPALYAHRGHFLKVIAIAARQVWIDHLRATRTVKRGGDAMVVPDDVAEQVALEIPDEQEDLLVALDELEKYDPRKRQVIDLHYLLGIDRSRIGRLLGVSIPTVDRDLAFSRAWLKSRLQACEP